MNEIILWYNRLGYIGFGYHDMPIECSFRIAFPNWIDKEEAAKINEEILKTKNKIDSIVKLKLNATAILDKNERGEPVLKIKGHGKDERCTYCRSFRTSLKNRMKELNYVICQEGKCKFE